MTESVALATDPSHIAPTADDARPRMALRLGVTGHRDMPPDASAAIYAAVATITEQILSAMKEAHKAPASRDFFNDAAPLLHVISPLAEGADRIVAKAALTHGANLVAALPFVETAYRADFPETVAEFDTLLADAERRGGVVVLDTAPSNTFERNQCYRAVGLFTVRNSDVIITVWDGKPSAGIGGTAEIVAYALEHQIPVIHIEKDAPHYTRLLDRVNGDHELTGDLLNARVKDLLWPRSINTTDSAERELLVRPVTATLYLRGERIRDTGAPIDYLYQGPYALAPSKFEAGLARIFPALLNWFRDGQELPPLDKTPPHANATTEFLYRHHQRADAVASFYSNLHRSVYVVVYQLSALALIAAILAQSWGGLTSYVFLGIELALLLATLGLIAADRIRAWRARWLGYRLLAETLRNADVMNQIGRPMPFTQMESLRDELPSHGWVLDIYRAVIREAGVCPARFDDEFVAKFRRYIKDVRVEDQIRYHRGTARRNRLAARRIGLAGTISFFVTLATVADKLFSVSGIPWAPFSSIAAVVTYGLFAIRNQAEFEIVSGRSIGMAQKLQKASQALAPLRDVALNSDHIAKQTLVIAAIMQHDAADWASIFENKKIEMG